MRAYRCSVLSLGISVLAVGGCTHLDVHSLKDEPAKRAGIAYYLPWTQFDTTMTWTVTDCSKGIKLTPKVTATARSAPDVDALYVIDYQSLDAFAKTSSVKVEFYDSGAIKSINAAAEDKLGEALGKSVGAIGKIAVALAGPAAASSDPACSASLSAALASAKALVSQIERDAEALALKTIQLDALSARVVSTGDRTSPALIASLNALTNEVAGAKLTLESNRKKLAQIQKNLTFSREVAFPDTSADISSNEAIVIPAQQLLKWMGADERALSPQEQAFVTKHAIWLRLAMPKQLLSSEANDADKKAGSRAGVRYRIGVPTRLEAFMGPAKTAAGWANEAALADLRFANLPVTVMQRNTTFYLPFESAPFTKAALTATFAESGVMTSAGYERTKAPAEGAADLLDSAAGTLGSTLTAIRDAKTTELERIKDETALAKAQKDLADAQKALVAAPPTPSQEALAALQTSTALKTAELAELQAEIALRKARGELAAAGGS